MKPRLAFFATLLTVALAGWTHAQTKAPAKTPAKADPNFIATPADLKARIPNQLHITKPDFVVFVPEVTDTGVNDTGNEHFLVFDGPDGSLMAVWTQSSAESQPDQHQAFARSADGGKTWSKPVIDKNLPCPGCQGSILRLNEKEILFSNLAVSRAGGFSLWSRRNLTLRLSGDDGRTGPHSLVLNEGLAGYSDLAVTKEGKILCVFENGKQDYCQKISVVQVDRAALVADDNPQQ